jgi:Ni,Fe-hydrogenase III small subunit/ferredoxin
MIVRMLKARLRQGYRTVAPDTSVPHPFRGRPNIEPGRCPDGCHVCADLCPTGAIATSPLRIDLGACLFCPTCADACHRGAIRWTGDVRLAARCRSDLHLSDARTAVASCVDGRLRSLLGRSLKLRQVSAGGCNGCESELSAMGNVVFDLSRYGIQFVASPRHADGLVITGPVAQNMRQALLDTYAATPAPRVVVAVGACAISGGAFAGSPRIAGIPESIPVDLYVPGCPPHPLTLLDGLLRMIGRRE